MTTRHPLMETFLNGESLVGEDMMPRVEACIQALVEHEYGQAMLDDRSFNDDGFWPAADAWDARYKPYVVVDGVLHIPVKGVLLHDFGYTISDWITGYVYIQRAFKRGMEDPAVKAVAFITHSPGGMVAGCFDAVDKMFAAKVKPVRAFAHEGAYSAAYAIVGGVADHIVVSRTGGVGSIGVVTSHIDASKAMEQAGYSRTWIYAGKHKVDGNSDGPLPADVKARIQTRIDESYEVFVSTVARNRTALSEEAIRETEALTFTASQALSNKLADSVGSLDDALAAYAADLSSTDGEDEMSTQDQAASQAAIDTAREEGRIAGHATGMTEGQAAGAAAERTRISAILDSDEAKDRPAAARMLAFDTDKAPEAVAASLAKLPKEAATSTETVVETPFDSAMDKNNPDLGANGKKPGGEDEAADPAATVFALAKSAGVRLQAPAQ